MNPAPSTLSDPGDPTSDTGVIRMSDLALVQRCSTLPRNYRKIISQRSEDGGSGKANGYGIVPPFPVNLPPCVEVHQVNILHVFEMRF